jgi:hypothetical protein
MLLADLADLKRLAALGLLLGRICVGQPIGRGAVTGSRLLREVHLAPVAGDAHTHGGAVGIVPR